MRLRPFFSFYGAKWRLAPAYPSPAFAEIVEPFAGSAQYALAYPDRQVHLNDVDPTIAGLWGWLVGANEDEVLALPDVGPTDRVADLGLPAGPSALIGFWLNKGMTAPCNMPSAWMRSASPTQRTQFWGPAIRERVAGQLRFIRHWTVSCEHWSRLARREATWFVDPPYQVRGSRYHYNKVDHLELGTWCRSLPGQVIACENEGADWLPFSPFRSAKARVHGRPSREVIWTNQ